MSQFDKLLRRFLSFPANFSYADLCRLLLHFGYHETNGGKTSGSLVEFRNVNHKYQDIIIHKPHPDDKVKKYALRKVAKILEKEGLI